MRRSSRAGRSAGSPCRVGVVDEHLHRHRIEGPRAVVLTSSVTCLLRMRLEHRVCERWASLPGHRLTHAPAPGDSEGTAGREPQRASRRESQAGHEVIVRLHGVRRRRGRPKMGISPCRSHTHRRPQRRCRVSRAVDQFYCAYTALLQSRQPRVITRKNQSRCVRCPPRRQENCRNLGEPGTTTTPPHGPAAGCEMKCQQTPSGYLAH